MWCPASAHTVTLLVLRLASFHFARINLNYQHPEDGSVFGLRVTFDTENNSLLKRSSLASLKPSFSWFSSCLSGHTGHSFLVTLRDLTFLPLNVCVGQESAPFYLGVLFIHGFTTFILTNSEFSPEWWTCFSNCLLNISQMSTGLSNSTLSKLIFSANLFLQTLFVREWHHLVPKLELLCPPY